MNGRGREKRRPAGTSGRARVPLAACLAACLAALSTLASPPAHAQECVCEADPRTGALLAPDVVIFGIVASIEDSDVRHPGQPDIEMVAVAIEVAAAWGPGAGPRMVVLTPAQGTDCSVSFVNGEWYYVGARGIGLTLYTDSCTGTYAAADGFEVPPSFWESEITSSYPDYVDEAMLLRWTPPAPPPDPELDMSARATPTYPQPGDSTLEPWSQAHPESPYPWHQPEASAAQPQEPTPEAPGLSLAPAASSAAPDEDGGASPIGLFRRWQPPFLPLTIALALAASVVFAWWLVRSTL